MTANIDPIYTKTPVIGNCAPSAANTKSDGSGTIGTDIFLGFTAGADGSWVSKVRMYPISSVAATATTQTVARIFVSSATSGAVTKATCWLVGEVSLPSMNASHSTTATNYVEFPLNFALPAGYTILVTNHSIPAANTNWMTVTLGGNF